MKKTLMITAINQALVAFFGKINVPEGRPIDFAQALTEGVTTLLQEGCEAISAFTTSARAVMYMVNVEAYAFHFDHTFAMLPEGLFQNGYARDGFVIEPVQSGSALAQLGLNAGLFPCGGELGFGGIDGYAVVRRGSIAVALITVRSYGRKWGVAFVDGQGPDSDLLALLDTLVAEQVIAPLYTAQRCELPGGEVQSIDLRWVASRLHRELVTAWEEQTRLDDEEAALEGKFHSENPDYAW